MEEDAVKPTKLWQSKEAKQYMWLFFKNLLNAVPSLQSNFFSAILIDFASSALFLAWRTFA
jgi:hypothetical protein